jgi:hypothetical protein
VAKRDRLGRALGGLVLVLLALRCGPKRELRTDVAPLARRLSLPASVRDVRWVAVPEHEDGCFPSIPEPDARRFVYAAIRLDAPAWRDLEARLPVRADGAATLPPDVARAILPAGPPPSGQVLDGHALASAPDVSVQSAVRAGDLLLLTLFLSR